MGEIKLSNSDEVALVDDEDVERLQGRTWHRNGNGYAEAGDKHGNYLMHRVVMGVLPGLVIDHKNHNRLDNRKENLRVVTHRENLLNRRPNKGCRSGYKGVIWHNKNKKWMASITIHGKLKTLGYFHDPVEAAKCYNKAAREHFGEFAWLNPIPDEQTNS